ncbi:hypothetical protein AXK11_01480 [Cephaloticoccus primus]|uniref:Threonylcarbamoyl-AMP synthase n=1 Tax=Cephaloticoccus primus TaxID=1548207 RepID=A0A139STE4_9BACT|nr:L-threonylcarbamoyladenylate synthase [Cephaloticoccus primus]KXU37853.1 hypothetical protein AXK11_01480 [Cephaloticoccus primus]
MPPTGFNGDRSTSASHARTAVTRTYRSTARNFAQLARRLAAGELVAVPSETVYGLAANALDAEACAKIFDAKGRPHSDPLIVHIHDIAQLAQIARAGTIAQKLARAFWPGPLTLVLPKTEAVPCIVTAGRDSVAVRMPRHPLFLKLLAACGLPLAAPSANPFGYVSPTSAAHVKAGLGGKISAILDGGPCEIGLESTILDARDEQRLRILRPGAISAAQLAQVAGCAVSDFTTSSSSATAARARVPAQRSNAEPAGQVAPGQLSRHYSPRAQVILHEKIPSELAATSRPTEALLYFSKPPADQPKGQAHRDWLTATGDQEEAARRLFAKLRELDAAGFKTLHVERAPSGILSTAINDRLLRASQRE